MSYFILESTDLTNKIRKVKSATPTKAIFESVLQTADEVNNNRRLYPKEVIQQALNDAKQRIADRRFGGELDHPIPTEDEKYSLTRHITLSLKEMSHIIYDFYWEGNKLIGTVETTTTPHGFILAGLIYDGVKVGFSIRALSDNIKYDSKRDIQIIGSPMTLIAIDAVSMPSHTRALVKEIQRLDVAIKEAAQMNCKNGLCVLEEHMNKLYKNYKLNDKTLNVIEEFYKGKLLNF